MRIATSILTVSLLMANSNVADAYTLNAGVRTLTRIDPFQLNMVGTVVDFGDAMHFEHQPAQVSESSFQSATLGLPTLPQLSPVEIWCAVRLEQWYEQALALKCPWMRRRSLDFVDTIEMAARLAIFSRKSLEVVGPTLGCRGDEKTAIKTKGLSIQAVADTIRYDWREYSQKGYYVTGAISAEVYRNDCFFDGPDPDMPIKGIRKFKGAASQLFDRKESTAELLNLQVEGDVIVAKWRMNGVLRLPWKPRMPEVVGSTTYYLDEDNLVYKHVESWDISAIEAFMKTFVTNVQSTGVASHGSGGHYM